MQELRKLINDLDKRDQQGDIDEQLDEPQYNVIVK